MLPRALPAAMTDAFRIPEEELRTWRDAARERAGLRGVAAVAAEMDAALARAGADGHAVVTRHQLFTWSQALQGAHARDPRAASAGVTLSLQQVAQDVSAVLAGRAAPARAPASAPARAASPAYAPPPPVEYARPASSAGGAVEVVAGAAITDAVRRLVRDARSELRAIAPWTAGLDSLAGELAQAAPQVRVLVISRRPEREDDHYHRAMGQLGHRRAVTAFSPLLYTRMLVQDEDRALVGAASAHPASFPHSRETGVLVSDRAAVRALREHFDRLHEEATRGR